MLEPEEVRSNLDDWLRNPSWKAIYDEAPSSACREYLKYMFFASEVETDEAFAALDAAFAKLSTDDLGFLMKTLEGPILAEIEARMRELGST